MGINSLSIGSPMGSSCADSMWYVKVLVMQSTSGFGSPKAIVIVAIVEAKEKKIRQSINMAFMFIFSPPFLFFVPEST